MTQMILSYFSTDGYIAPLPFTSSGGQLVSINNPTTAVTVSNPSTAVTITNPTTQVNTLSSGPILVLSSGPMTLSSAPLVIVASSGGTIPVTLSTVVSLSSVHTVTATGPVTITSGTVTLSSAPSVQQGASLIAGVSTGPWIVDLRNQVFSSVPQFAEVSATSSGHVTIVSAVTSMRIYVLGYALIADTSNTASWESSNTDISGSMLFSTAGAGLVCPLVGPGQGAWLATSVNGDLGLLLGNAGTIAGHLTYYTASS